MISAHMEWILTSAQDLVYSVQTSAMCNGYHYYLETRFRLSSEIKQELQKPTAATPETIEVHENKEQIDSKVYERLFNPASYRYCEF